MEKFNYDSYMRNNPLLNEDDDRPVFGPKIEKSRPGNLSDYYRFAEPTVTHVAKELDQKISELVEDKSRLEELTDLIVALTDAYAEEYAQDIKSK